MILSNLLQFSANKLREMLFQLLNSVLFFNFVASTKVFDLVKNDRCFSSLNNSDGICVEPSDCENFMDNRNEMNICSFNHKLPIVCCPKLYVFDRTKTNFQNISKSSKGILFYYKII